MFIDLDEREKELGNPLPKSDLDNCPFEIGAVLISKWNNSWFMDTTVSCFLFMQSCPESQSNWPVSVFWIISTLSLFTFIYLCTNGCFPSSLSSNWGSEFSCCPVTVSWLNWIWWITIIGGLFKVENPQWTQVIGGLSCSQNLVNELLTRCMPLWYNCYFRFEGLGLRVTFIPVFHYRVTN